MQGLRIQEEILIVKGVKLETTIFMMNILKRCVAPKIAPLPSTTNEDIRKLRIAEKA